MTFIKYLRCYAVTVYISVTVCRNLKQRVITSYNSVMIRLIPMHRCSNCISSYNPIQFLMNANPQCSYENQLVNKCEMLSKLQEFSMEQQYTDNGNKILCVLTI